MQSCLKLNEKAQDSHCCSRFFSKFANKYLQQQKKKENNLGE